MAVAAESSVSHRVAPADLTGLDLPLKRTARRFASRARWLIGPPVGPRESVGAFAGPALVIPVLKAVRGRRGIKTAIAEYPRFCVGAEAGFQSLRAAEGRDRDVVADHQGGEHQGGVSPPSASCYVPSWDDPEVSDRTDEFRLLKHCGRDGSSGGRGGYLKKSLDRNITGPLASTGPSKNLRDARSSIASRSRTN
jgi:hypothetical protein